jgi:hypothetical protein
MHVMNLSRPVILHADWRIVQTSEQVSRIVVGAVQGTGKGPKPHPPAPSSKNIGRRSRPRAAQGFEGLARLDRAEAVGVD